MLLWASPLLVWRIIGLYYYLDFNESLIFLSRAIFAISVNMINFFCRTEDFMKEIQILMIIGTRKIMFICYLIFWIYLTIWTYPKGEKLKLHSTKFLDVRALIGKTMVVIKKRITYILRLHKSPLLCQPFIICHLSMEHIIKRV
jgi:hypothetical protein